MRIKTKSLALASILTALTFILGMTPIGIIPLGVINVTIMCIPVIIGTLVCGLKVGMLLGAAFGLASTLAAFGLSFTAQSTLAAALIPYSPLAVIAMSMIPRLMIPVVTHFVARLIFKNKKRSFAPIAVGVASVTGSLTNTVLYLGLMYIFYSMVGLDAAAVVAVIMGTGMIAGPAEALVAVIIAVPVTTTVLRSRKTRPPERQPARQPARAKRTPYNQKAYNQKADIVAPKGTQSMTVPQIESEFEEATLVNVASLPNATEYYNDDTDMKKRLLKKGEEYLTMGAMELSFSMYTRYIGEFSEDARHNARLYVLLKFVDAGQYEYAGKVLAAILNSGAACDDTARRAVSGAMRVIHSSLKHEDEGDMAVKNAVMREKLYEKSMFFLDAGQNVLAGQMFSRYMAL